MTVDLSRQKINRILLLCMSVSIPFAIGGIHKGTSVSLALSDLVFHS